MDFLGAFLNCLTGREDLPEGNTAFKTATFAESSNRLATEIVDTLFTADKPPLLSKQQIDGIVHTEGWYEDLAKRILERMISALDDGRAMGHAMKQAFDRASDVANEFIQKHPVFAVAIATVVAIGILVLLVPWVVEALGFAEFGPVEGSFAAWWQSTFPDAEAGSIFSYLQRLGMKWARH